MPKSPVTREMRAQWLLAKLVIAGVFNEKRHIDQTDAGEFGNTTDGGWAVVAAMHGDVGPLLTRLRGARSGAMLDAELRLAADLIDGTRKLPSHKPSDLSDATFSMIMNVAAFVESNTSASVPLKAAVRDAAAEFGKSERWVREMLGTYKLALKLRSVPVDEAKALT